MTETAAGPPVAQESVTRLTASEIAAKVAARELSAREVADAHIARIEEVDGRLNAVVCRRFAEARAEADALDSACGRGERLGLLAGVPTTVKEQWNVEGLPTTYGLPSRAGQRAGSTAPLVGRLQKAGAVVLGKTNTPQLLMYLEGDNPLYGRTNNPWDLERTTGGGTAGEGAIISAGGSALGLATDIAGSIRVPGHFCGVAGLKPTSFRLSTAGAPREFFLPGFFDIMLDPGPFGRGVADLELAMSVLAAPGLEAIDPRIPPVPWNDPRAIDVEGLRIGFFDDDGFFPCSPGIRRVVREAADALRARGAEVEPFGPVDGTEANAIFIAFAAADGMAWVKTHARDNPIDRRTRTLRQLANLPDALKPALARALEAAGQKRLAESVETCRHLSMREYWDLILRRDRFRTGFIDALDRGRFDAIVCPPYPLPAVRHGAMYYLFTAASYSVLFNVLGLPTGVLPASRVRPGEESDRKPSRDLVERAASKSEEGSAGLPLAVQIAGRLWREDVVLAVMGALEQHFRHQPGYPDAPPL